MAHVRDRKTASGVVYDVRYRVRVSGGWKERSFTTRRHDEALLAKISIENGQEPARAIPDQTTLREYWASCSAGGASARVEDDPCSGEREDESGAADG